MGLTASSLSQFATRAAAARASLWAAVLTFSAVDYACAIDPDELSRMLEPGGFREERTLSVVLALSTGIVPILGYPVTIKTTATDALETLVFSIKSIHRHPDNPEVILTLAMKP